MPNNLHVSYDLNVPGQNYDAVIAKIKSLGAWAKIHKSYWFVSTNLSAQQAAAAVWSVMDARDTVYVADTTNNVAYWYNISPEASKFITEHWAQSLQTRLGA